jgi:hypothetical protein
MKGRKSDAAKKIKQQYTTISHYFSDDRRENFIVAPALEYSLTM